MSTILEGQHLKPGVDIISDNENTAKIENGDYQLKISSARGYQNTTCFRGELLYKNKHVTRYYGRDCELLHLLSWFYGHDSKQKDKKLIDCPTMADILNTYCWPGGMFEGYNGVTGSIRKYLRKPAVISYAAGFKYAAFIIKGARKFFGIIFFESNLKYVSAYEVKPSEAYNLIQEMRDHQTTVKPLDEKYSNELVAELV